jgi:hypothetical protein
LRFSLVAADAAAGADVVAEVDASVEEAAACGPAAGFRPAVACRADRVWGRGRPHGRVPAEAHGQAADRWLGQAAEFRAAAHGLALQAAELRKAEHAQVAACPDKAPALASAQGLEDQVETSPAVAQRRANSATFSIFPVLQPARSEAGRGVRVVQRPTSCNKVAAPL